MSQFRIDGVVSIGGFPLLVTKRNSSFQKSFQVSLDDSPLNLSGKTVSVVIKRNVNDVMPTAIFSQVEQNGLRLDVTDPAAGRFNLVAIAGALSMPEGDYLWSVSITDNATGFVVELPTEAESFHWKVIPSLFS